MAQYLVVFFEPSFQIISNTGLGLCSVPHFTQKNANVVQFVFLLDDRRGTEVNFATQTICRLVTVKKIPDLSLGK